jgi:multidrug efflux pump subunit AcrA (membrane-fusion protein)
VQTPVKLGQLQNNRYQLISGLQKGETVVVSNTALLRTGLPVKVSTTAASN